MNKKQSKTLHNKVLAVLETSWSSILFHIHSSLIKYELRLLIFVHILELLTFSWYKLNTF